ncbi:UDP-glycosyltransferase 83A1-like [Abrus precatorius]|uniref:UDP-glycosyltransferase 83A1-like n=1 Tax=Abrus precatorius TaxID=3816 RepID=A0A8B8L7V3_ABRPR|nr:UDP-glycosyltransferase 83A1-like [Abrus precatorius]
MGMKHVLVLPFPAQGHVNPLMHFSQKLTQQGFKVTFINTDFNHKRKVSATNEHVNHDGFGFRLISVPDGLGPHDDRNDLASLCMAILSTMPCLLEKVIRDINAFDNGSEKITGIVADANMAWSLEIANKLGIKSALFCPCSAAIFVLQDNIPRLIEDGIIDSDGKTFGFPIVKGKFQLSPRMPVMDTADIPWCCIGDSTEQKIIYNYIANMMQYSQLTDWWLCNSNSELELGALSLSPKILPIGPLKEIDDEFRSLGQFWEEDLSCLTWLDQQSPCSVIYIAFGSFTVFDPDQFKELALGLELTNKSFLWVVREDASGGTKNAYPDEFQGTCGKIVKWAPQQKVLSHPATACFISHCGWNSTMEGVSNGVPFLCWPYFADQLFDKAYICDMWNVGLGFDLDEKGLISRWEIKKKVDQLLGDENLRGRCQKLKEMIINNNAVGGQSYENFRKFEEWLKG